MLSHSSGIRMSSNETISHARGHQVADVIDKSDGVEGSDEQCRCGAVGKRRDRLRLAAGHHGANVRNLLNEGSRHLTSAEWIENLEVRRLSERVVDGDRSGILETVEERTGPHRGFRMAEGLE